MDSIATKHIKQVLQHQLNELAERLDAGSSERYNNRVRARIYQIKKIALALCIELEDPEAPHG